MEKATVIFQPSGHRGRVPKGWTVMDAARRLGEQIETLCGGKGLCGKCRISVQDGSYSKYGIVSSPDHLSGWKDTEARFITPEERKEGFRLACLARIEGDILIYVPEESRAAKPVITKQTRVIPVEPDPAVRNYQLTVPKSNNQHPESDFEWLIAGLSRNPELKDRFQHIDLHSICDLEVLRQLPRRLRQKDREITASIWRNREVIRIQSGHTKGLYGIAVDIGTTTMVAALVDLDNGTVLETRTAMNPQIQFGEDVIARINYHQTHADGLSRMSEHAISTLNSLIEELISAALSTDSSEDAGAGLRLEREDIVDMTIVCNTVMHHILLQLDPDFLARAPFPPVLRHSLDLKANIMGIRICPSAYVHLLPIEAAFVGADNVAVLLAEAPHHGDQLQLIIDVGTNGELALGNRDRIYTVSCATGPAFEGAEISFGMRASAGAIERISIAPETHEVAYKVVGKEIWSSYAKPEEMDTRGICGSGIMDLLAELYRAGIILSSGAFNPSQKSSRFRINKETGQKEFIIARKPETAIGRDITVTQKDIRQIQLAKAAIYAGCKFLMTKWGTDTVDVIKIAGGFGLHIDPEKILIMGMIPDCDPKTIVAVGNAAGTGAVLALMNMEKRAEADQIALKVENVELSTQQEFKDEFIKALAIPHSEDPFPHIEPLVSSRVLSPTAPEK